MRTVRWDARTADGRWHTGVERVATVSSAEARDKVCEMLWARGYVGSYRVEVTA